jgi:hypothetical protein
MDITLGQFVSANNSPIDPSSNVVVEYMPRDEIAPWVINYDNDAFNLFLQNKLITCSQLLGIPSHYSHDSITVAFGLSATELMYNVKVIHTNYRPKERIEEFFYRYPKERILVNGIVYM